MMMMKERSNRPPLRAHQTSTWRLIVEYDGTRYSGWQEQSNARTVAGEIRKAAAAVLRGPVDLDAAGRTDAGVHALAQVARLRATRRIGAADLASGLNQELPRDICIIRVEPADPSFHPRHDALLRYYIYQISNRKTSFARPYVWWIREPLRLAPMQEAASLLIGRHDFERFADKRAKEQSHLVMVERVELTTAEDLILFRIGASHFLWKMVRRLVGALVEVGRSTMEPADFALLFASQPLPNRLRTFSPAAHTAPASGLFLERVVYEEDEEPGELRPAIPVRSGRASC
jgi:tRNA pseudouridine38-40 synthase